MGLPNRSLFINNHPSQGQVATTTVNATVEAILWAGFNSSGNPTTATRTVMNAIKLWPEITNPQLYKY